MRRHLLHWPLIVSSHNVNFIYFMQFPSTGYEMPLDSSDTESLHCMSAVHEILWGDIENRTYWYLRNFSFSVSSYSNCYIFSVLYLLDYLSDGLFNFVYCLAYSNPWGLKQPIFNEDDVVDDKWWNLYDNLWIIISDINGKGPSKSLPKSASMVGPSFGQRARGLVESLNIPAAEMAAVVVSGGISNALVGKPSKTIDKAMLLRGERWPRIVFRMVILYLCRSSLERASRCVQQVVSLLPSLLATDDEQSKGRLQLFIW